MQQQPAQDPMIIYRIESLERMVQQLQTQLQQYVPYKENELQLRSIKDTVERIEREIGIAKAQLTDVNNKLAENKLQEQERDSKQRQSQSDLQLRFFYYVSTLIGAIIVALLVYYFTHPH